MPSFDERTSRGWFLPHTKNKLFHDVLRIRNSLIAIDTELEKLEEKSQQLLEKRISVVEQKQQSEFDRLNDTASGLNARMDSIAGSVTEDSEVLDARIDSENETHKNLGDSLRQIHKQLLLFAEQIKNRIQPQINVIANSLSLVSMSDIAHYRENEKRIKAESQQLNSQIDKLANTIIKDSENLIQEAQQRRAQIKELKEANIKNIKENQEVTERIKAEIENESDIRLYQTNKLQNQIDTLSEASFKNAFNVKYEAEQRRKGLSLTAEKLQETSKKLEASIENESVIHCSQEEKLQIQINTLSEGDLRNATNLHYEMEQRRKKFALFQERIEKLKAELTELNIAINDINDDLKNEIAVQDIKDEKLQNQIDTLSEASFKNAFNVRNEAQQRRKVDKELDFAIENNKEKIHKQINTLSESDLRNAANLHYEMEQRRKGFSKVYELIKVINITLKGLDSDLEEETSERIIDDEAGKNLAFGINKNLQSQIDALSTAKLKQMIEQSKKYHQLKNKNKFDILQLKGLSEKSVEIALKQLLKNHELVERDKEIIKNSAKDNAQLQHQIDVLATSILQNAMTLTQKEGRASAQRTKNKFSSDINEIKTKINNLQVALSKYENKSPTNWSDAENLQIPEPRCAIVNFSGIKSMPTSKTSELKAFMEFWDMQGNYFKKKILCSAQGSSSMGYVKKNVKFDLLNGDLNDKIWDDDNSFNLRIGDWVEQDGFHLKAYYTDFFRGIGVTSYKLWDEIMRFNGIFEDRPWKKQLIEMSQIGTTTKGFDDLNDLTLQFDTGALCHPDGFPCIVYLNGDFYGIFSWQIKKQRKNYHMDKSTVEHIHLDGSLTTVNFWNGDINWTTFEIRNPNKLYTMSGDKYDGDSPKELIDETSENYSAKDKNHVRSAKVKKYIRDFVENFAELKSLYSAYRANMNDDNLLAVKTKYEQIFDVENQRDYLIFSDIVKNSDGFAKNWQWTTYDGKKWYVNAYDLDMSFGGYFQGNQITAPLNGHITTSTALPTYYVALLYKEELEQRYKELRNSGILTPEHIISMVENWTKRIGENNYELEYKRWPDSPCNGENVINSEYWELKKGEKNNTSTYNAEKEYEIGEQCSYGLNGTMGFYVFS